MTKKTSYAPFVTGRMVARFPHLETPDTFKGKTQYKVDGVPQAGVGGALKKEIEAFAANVGAGSGRPIKKDKKDGTVFFVFKSHRKPMVTDAAGNPLPKGAQVGAGSIIRVAGSMADYEPNPGAPNGGVTLYVDAVRVLELKQGRNAENPFGDAEDGYVADGAAERDPFDGAESNNSVSDDDDMSL